MIKPNIYLDALKQDFYNYGKGRKEKFDEKDFYSLDVTLDMILYSYLSHFRAEYAETGVPCGYTTEEEWFQDLDTVLAGLKLALTKDTLTEEERKIVYDARILLVNIWQCLWF